MKKGIDVSSHNGYVNWYDVKNRGYEFALIRCGFGDDYYYQDDKQYLNNVNECERLGIPYGVYLYSYALNMNQSNSEVNHVLRLIKNLGQNFKLGVWLDMEDGDNYKENNGMPSNETLVNICYNFCDRIEKEGYYSGIYANLNWLQTKLNNNKLNRFDKWVAQWADKCTYDKKYSIWQYTNNEYIDNKRFDGDYLVNKFWNDQSEKIDVIYQVYTNRWLPNIENYNNVNINGYAGLYGQAISGIRANLTKGNIYYKVHIKNDKWLGEIKNREKEFGYGDDYAGILGKPFDGLMVRVDVGKVRYRVHIKNGKWLPWVDGYNENDFINGYAGIFGYEIDGVQLSCF